MSWATAGTGAISGAATGMSFGPIGAGIGGLLGGIFGALGDSGNANQQFGDPNSPIYRQLQKQYFDNLQRTLNAGSPGTQGLLSLATAKGGDYGGSQYIANKQRQDITSKNNETAANQSSQYMSNLMGEGMSIYAKGNQEASDSMGNMNNQFLKMGLGALGGYLNQGGGTGNFSGQNGMDM